MRQCCSRSAALQQCRVADVAALLNCEDDWVHCCSCAESHERNAAALLNCRFRSEESQRLVDDTQNHEVAEQQSRRGKESPKRIIAEAQKCGIAAAPKPVILEGCCMGASGDRALAVADEQMCCCRSLWRVEAHLLSGDAATATG